jgi:hypothetical protein
MGERASEEAKACPNRFYPSADPERHWLKMGGKAERKRCWSGSLKWQSRICRPEDRRMSTQATTTVGAERQIGSAI